MSVIVGAPWININRRTIRAPLNPLDRSTIVSIYPIPIEAHKPTIQPGMFRVPAGKYDDPSILIVGSSSWWRELDDEQPLLEIPVYSIQVADSVVNDYINGLLACDMDAKKPGLLYVPGCKNDKNGEPSPEATKIWIKTEHKEKLDVAREKQRSWFAELVKIADILWSRTNGNPIAINDQMRMAAQELQIKNKPWLADFNTLELTNCPACGVLRNNLYPVCQHCKAVIDRKRFEELGLKFAV